MALLRLVNLGVRFLLELASLAALAYWAATLHLGSAGRALLALLVPAAAVAFWGLFVSPKARFPTGRGGRAGLGLLVFLAAAGALDARGHDGLAGAFAAVAVVSSILLYALPE